MSYISILKNIPEILSQPTGIAAIASLGIHGAIALIVPLMPVDSHQSAATDSTKAVGLMELSPSDQNRLPQSQPSQVALQSPQLPQQQPVPLINFGNQEIPPLEPGIQAPLLSKSVLPPIPTSSANYNLASLPRRQPIPRFGRNDFSTQVSNFRVRNTFSPSESPFVDDIDAKIKETQALNINKLPQVQADNKLPSEALINPSADAIDVGSTETPQGVAESQNIQLADNPVEISANYRAVLPPQSSPTAKEQLGETVPMAIPSPETSTQQQTQLPTLSESNSQGKDREGLLAKLDSYNTLRQTIQTEYPNVKEQAVIRETISTNKQDGIEGTVLGRLVVDGDGKVLDIKFQGGSVSAELQSKTREFFNANPPKGENRISSYPFQLRFTNNVDKKAEDLKPLPNQQVEPVSEPQVNKNQPNNHQDQQVEPVSKSQVNKNQPNNNQAVVIPNPSSTPVVSDVQPEASTPEKLIQKLRQIKEQQ